MDIVVCGRQYAAALYEYSRTAKNDPASFALPQIYFVEIEQKKYSQLVEQFNAFFPTNPTDLLKIQPIDQQSQTLYTRSCSSFEENEINLNSNVDFRLNIHEGDIRNLTVDAIVCPEIKTVKNGGFLATGIKFRFRKDVNEKDVFNNPWSRRKNIIKTKISKTPCDVKYIFHASLPVWTQDNDTSSLQDVMKSLFDKISKHSRSEISSVAIPVLGIGNNS